LPAPATIAPAGPIAKATVIAAFLRRRWHVGLHCSSTCTAARVPVGPARVDELIDAIDALTHCPCIGRPVKGDKRELVIGRAGAAMSRSIATWNLQTPSSCWHCAASAKQFMRMTEANRPAPSSGAR